jgi:aspartyl aminopeptidase
MARVTYFCYRAGGSIRSSGTLSVTVVNIVAALLILVDALHPLKMGIDREFRGHNTSDRRWTVIATATAALRWKLKGRNLVVFRRNNSKIIDRK